MSFTVRIDDIAQRDIDNFVAYQSEYSEAFAVEQIDRLYRVFNFHLAQAPMTWGNFFITGEPYHAYLFRVGRRTSYWIVYTVDEANKIVTVLRFWNASRDDKAFEI